MKADREFLLGFTELINAENLVTSDFQFLGYFEFYNRSQKTFDDDFKNPVFGESECIKVCVRVGETFLDIA